MVRTDLVRWLTALVLRDPEPSRGWPAVAATGVLCWLIRRRQQGRPGWNYARMEAIAAGVTILRQSTDDRLRARVQRALKARWEDPDLAYMVVESLGHAELNRGIVAFLLTPAPASPHMPKVTLVDLLRHRLSFRATEAFTGRVIEGALESPDDGIRRMLTELLSETDHPELLDALMGAFSRASDQERWDGGQPTELTRLCLANPHLPQGAPRAGRDALLLALLKDRPDAVAAHAQRFTPYTVVSDLLAVRSPAPSRLVRRCRKVLRSLEPGPLLEALCQSAMDGDPVARGIVVKAKHLPAEQHFLFFYLTRQWDRYDQVDPDGTLMREWFARHRRGGSQWDYHRYLRYSGDVLRIAAMTGRPSPLPPTRPHRRRTRSGSAAGATTTGYGADHPPGDGFGTADTSAGYDSGAGGYDGGAGGYSDGGGSSGYSGYSGGFSGGGSY